MAASELAPSEHTLRSIELLAVLCATAGRRRCAAGGPAGSPARRPARRGRAGRGAVRRGRLQAGHASCRGSVRAASRPAGIRASTSMPSQAERLRKLLLALASDVRLVLMRLALQLVRMRGLKTASADETRRAALETREIYAPLANRLGIWQVKWELEDLAFRFSQPEDYKRIAGWLRVKRGDREQYIEDVKRDLRRELDAVGITRRDHRPAKTHLQHLAQDAAQVAAVRAGHGRARGACHGGHDRRLLRGARHRARPVAVHPRRVRRLHRDAQGQQLSLAAHGRDRAGQVAARSPDPHPRDACARRTRRRGALAIQGRPQGRERVSSRRSSGCGSCSSRRSAMAPNPICSPTCRRRCSRTACMR